MKKFIATFVFVLAAAVSIAQQPCQANFSYSYNSVTGEVNLYDMSFNMDSTPINISSWAWSVQYNGVNYTYTTQNPSFTVNPASFNSALVCLTINTIQPPCQSTFCDTIYANFIPTDTCDINFNYTVDTSHYVYHFYDQSYTNLGTINSWAWTIKNSNQTVIFTSNLQNPVFTFPQDGFYEVCLHAVSTGGCNNTSCQQVYVYDSTNQPCQPTVTSIVNHVSVINGNDGSIDLTVTGGAPPYVYQWSNGANTQDISNLTAGVYTVNISSLTMPACPSYTYTFAILQPFDSANAIIDTLVTSIIDTCFNFTPDSFYVAAINVTGNTVIVTWVFTGMGMSATLNVSYTFTSTGAQMVILSINCNQKKGIISKQLTTYMSYIYISHAFGTFEPDAKSKVLVYPNPVSDRLNFTLSSDFEDAVKANVFSYSGKLIKTTSLQQDDKSYSIDVAELPVGLYLLTVENSNGVVFTARFVK